MSISDSLDQVRHARAIRCAIYDLGTAIAALYVATQVATSWPGYQPYALSVGIAVCFWMGMMKYDEWKKLESMEKEDE